MPYLQKLLALKIMYTEARLEREIFNGLEKIEKEFAKIEDMIAAVVCLIL